MFTGPGIVFAIGDNYWGQLGVSSMSDIGTGSETETCQQSAKKTILRQVTGMLSGIMCDDVCAGAYVSYALTFEGQLFLHAKDSHQMNCFCPCTHLMLCISPWCLDGQHCAVVVIMGGGGIGESGLITLPAENVLGGSNFEDKEGDEEYQNNASLI